MSKSNFLLETTFFASPRKIQQLVLFLLFSAFPLLLSQFAWADQLKLAWNPSLSSNSAGYKVYYGTASRAYGASIDIGNVITYTLTGLTPGQTYFIALTAYNHLNVEGAFSNEVSGVPITAMPVNYPPTVTVSASPTSGTAPLTVAFAGMGSDVDGDPLVYFWTFGDGGTSAAQNPSHTYNAAGTYTVTVTVSDGKGGTASANANITVASSIPAVPATLEAENFATRTTGGPIAGGWIIWSNGYIEDSLNFPESGIHDFIVTAYGSAAVGIWPNMEIRIDQNPIGNVTVNSASWSTYIIRGNISAGIHRVAIAFTNDYYSPAEDRNLFIGKVSISARTANATTTISGSTNGLVACWTMDEGSGATASDFSGLGNNGLVSGGATWTVGKVGGALSLDGIDGAVTVPNVRGLAAGNTAHTLAAWVKVIGLPSSRAWILLLGNEGTGSHHWLINSLGVTQFGVWNGGQVYPRLPLGEWKHIAVTFDGATLAGYVDGVLVESGAAIFDLEGMPLTIGGLHTGENNFNGMVDEVRIYDRALTGAEIAALAATDLVGHWTMDDGMGATLSDSSGLGNDGAVSGGATWTLGKVGGALSLDGINGAVTVPNVRGLAGGNTAHTVAAWVKVIGLPSNRAWILLLGNEGTGSHHWLINSLGVTQLGVWNGGQVYPMLPLGEWKHIAVTFDGATLAGYVDGMLVGSGAGIFDLEGMPLTIGGRHIGENNFNGIVDEVRIYDRALTAAEIAALAAEGISRQ